METTLIILGVIAIILSCIPLFFSIQFYKGINAYFNKKSDNNKYKASLIVPCKGLDPGFKENIESLFNQNYPDYEIIFVTATSDDPAFPILSDIISAFPDVTAKLHTAGTVKGRSQKINNQICGLQHVEKDSQIFVFIDSDSRPKRDFLVNLISPLSDKSIGIATGFRWYLPVKNTFFSFLRSTWNGGGIVFLSNPKANYAWGGAMAIRKEVFYECNVLDYWQNALSDDMTISLAVRQNNLNITFVPKCLVVTHEDCTMSEMFEWTNRQTIISKVYHPNLWKSILFVHGTGNIILCVGMVLLIFHAISIINSPQIIIAAILMLSIIPMEMLNGVFLLPSIIRMLPEHRKKLKRVAIVYCLMAPLASILVLINSLYSLFTNEIKWRGITYKMKSITETIVVDEKSNYP
ncbi:glycosyltransferase [uncultured Desulfobacter sp.]|uniref:glycosyltransferase n=1 Tax=uncultured Desulfobacter sp. TaxID=240139 RepID=UPI0029F4A1B7|nr:glycosyltransferase [uncultured Desulfobacter sp.]